MIDNIPLKLTNNLTAKIIVNTAGGDHWLVLFDKTQHQFVYRIRHRFSIAFWDVQHYLEQDAIFKQDKTGKLNAPNKQYGSRNIDMTDFPYIEDILTIKLKECVFNAN